MGRIINGYTPRPSKPSIFSASYYQGIKHGVVGNDVNAGPLLSTAHWVLTKEVSVGAGEMQKAYETSIVGFNEIITRTQTNLYAAFESFQTGLGGKSPPEIIHPTTAQLADLKEKVNTAVVEKGGSMTPAEESAFREKIQELYNSIGAQLGKAVNKSVGVTPTAPPVLEDEPGDNTSAIAHTTGNAPGTAAKEVTQSAQARSQLCFVNYSRRAAGSSAFVPGVSGADLESAMRGNGAVSGTLRESILNYHDEAIIIGDPPKIERRFSTYAADDASGKAGLEPAWTAAEQTGFLAYVTAHPNAAGWEEACILWPTVFAAYRIAAGFDFLEGTKWSTKGQLLARRHAKICPTLVSGYNVSTSPTNWRPLDIPFEISEDDGATWTITTYYNGLKLSPDGQYFFIENLRELTAAHKTWRGSLDNPSAIVPNDIRATLAVEADFRITGYAGRALDPNATAQRIDSDGDGETTFAALGNPGDYVEWLRHSSSQPLGSAIADANPALFPAKASENNELFSDRPGSIAAPTGRIVTHAMNRLQDVKRIEGSGQIEFRQFDPGFLPGMQITKVLDAGIPVSGVVKAVTIEAGRQAMIVAFG